MCKYTVTDSNVPFQPQQGFSLAREENLINPKGIVPHYTTASQILKAIRVSADLKCRF